MAKGDNNLLMLAVAGGVAYYAYTQGWLSFLGLTPAASAVAAAPAAPVQAAAAPAQIAPTSTPVASAPVNPPASLPILTVADVTQSRVRQGGYVPPAMLLQPSGIAQRFTRTGSTVAGLTGYRRRGR